MVPSVNNFVRRILVAEQLDELLLRYLDSVRGVADSDGLDWNASREQLQKNRIMKATSRKLVQKEWELMKKLAMQEDGEDGDEVRVEGKNENKEGKAAEGKKDKKEDDDEKKNWTTFWRECNNNLKIACYEDDSNLSKLPKLLRRKNGEAEALAYKEYYDWCDDMAKNAGLGINTVEAKKEKLEAKIGERTSSITASISMMEELVTAIVDDNAELKDETTVRTKEAADLDCYEDGSDRPKIPKLFRFTTKSEGKEISLLKEGEAEAKAGKEYPDWCDDMAKNAGFEIKAADADKEQLGPKIGELTSNITVSTSKIEELVAAFAADDAEWKDATTVRAKETADFAKNEAELVGTSHFGYPAQQEK